MQVQHGIDGDRVHMSIAVWLVNAKQLSAADSKRVVHVLGLKFQGGKEGVAGADNEVSATGESTIHVTCGNGESAADMTFEPFWTLGKRIQRRNEKQTRCENR